MSEPYIEEVVIAYDNEGQVYNADFGEYVVPNGTIFVLGDNRTNSADSRYFGAISTDHLIGKVMTIRHAGEEESLH